MHRLRTILSWLINSNIYVGLCAVSLAISLQLVETDTFPKAYRLLFIFFATVAGYTFLRSRILYTPEPVVENSYYNYARSNALFINMQIIACSLIAAVIFFYMKPIGRHLSLVAVAVTALYALPFLVPLKGLKGLRSLGLLKTLFVAIVWVIITSPVLFIGGDPDGRVSTNTLLFNLFYVWALCIVFEIKDEKYDRIHNLDTMPIRWGADKTRQLAMVSLGLAVGIALYYLADKSSLHHLPALLLSYLVTAWLIFKAGTETDDDYYYIAVDGAMIVQALLVIVSHFTYAA